jgi:hypothetical protein
VTTLLIPTKSEDQISHEAIMAERDEARAEVAAAFRRGAEAMREAAVRLADGFFFTRAYGRRLAEQIRAMPIPEDKP